jgi:seryl-tRNA synthetase
MINAQGDRELNSLLLQKESFMEEISKIKNQIKSENEGKEKYSNELDGVKMKIYKLEEETASVNVDDTSQKLYAFCYFSSN